MTDVMRPVSGRKGRIKEGSSKEPQVFGLKSLGGCYRKKLQVEGVVEQEGLWQQVETNVGETAWRREHSTGFIIGIDFTRKVFSYDCSRCQNKPLQFDQGLERLYREDDKIKRAISCQTHLNPALLGFKL